MLISFTPSGSERITTFSSYKFPPLRKTGIVCYRIKAVTEKRDNLDRLQRVTQHQQQPKKKAAQVSSPGMHDGFPSARTVQQMIDTMERMMEDPYTGGKSLPLFPARMRDRYSGYGTGRKPWAIKEGKMTIGLGSICLARQRMISRSGLKRACL